MARPVRPDVHAWGRLFWSWRAARRLQPVSVLNAARSSEPCSQHRPSSERLRSQKERSMSHLFAIQVSGIDLKRDYEDILYGAGCDDALIAVIDDVVYLDFTREA